MTVWTKAKIAAVGVAVVVLLSGVGGVVWWLNTPPPPVPLATSQPAVAPVPAVVIQQPRAEGPVAPDDLKFKAVPVDDPSLAGFPYAPGWPLALPGQIVATPVVADLEGNGKLDIVVPCIMRNRGTSLVHPQPNALPLLFAFHFDGTPVRGWPVTLSSGNGGANIGGWASSPSVLHRNGHDDIVLLLHEK